MTGLAYIDSKNLMKDQIFRDEQGNLYIKTKFVKMSD